MVESLHPVTPPAAQVEPTLEAEGCASSVWLGESDPAAFLAEVVTTLTGFLREGLEAGP